MDDWGEDQSIPDMSRPLKNNWDDEDLDDVKECWEDEDEPAPAAKVEKAAVSSGEEEGKVREEAPFEPIEEKLRQQQRLVEEADLKSATELFGKKGDAKTLDNFIPKTTNDFAEYAELVAHKLRQFEKSCHYIGLLKAVMRLSLTSLKGADAKEVASSVTAIANEKIKVEKEANAGKKKTGASH